MKSILLNLKDDGSPNMLAQITDAESNPIPLRAIEAGERISVYFFREKEIHRFEAPGFIAPILAEWARLKSRANATRAYENHFGLCPECGKTDGFLNYGRDHWFVCHTHKVRWFVGSNLFSAWRSETQEIWDANRKRINGYKDITGREANR